jgi:pimeloyl-ACP methyl ester carboxylesterase
VIGRLVLLAGMLAPMPARSSECVVLLHGLGRSYLSMTLLQCALENSGYTVWNRGYRSTEHRIEELEPVVGEALDYCRKRKARRIHFVTHSMGGILVRAYFQNHEVPEAGRVVMLAPPNHGSEVVDAYRDRWWFKWATGPAGQQLGTASDSLPNRLKPVPLEIGVIAGRRTSDPWFGGVFSGPNDGKVSLAGAVLPEMKELAVVDSGHTFMVNSPTVIAYVKHFLRDGVFAVEADTVARQKSRPSR